jgi:hypothetical protein
MEAAPSAFACPHCHGLGITERSRSHSSPGWPAACQLCGKLSYNGSRVLRVVIGVLATTIAPAATLFFWFAAHRAMACAILVITALAGFVVGRVADPRVMRPVTPAQRDLSRVLTYVSLLVFVALVLAACLYVFSVHKAT